MALGASAFGDQTLPVYPKFSGFCGNGFMKDEVIIYIQRKIPVPVCHTSLRLSHLARVASLSSSSITIKKTFIIFLSSTHSLLYSGLNAVQPLSLSPRSVVGSHSQKALL